MVSSPPIRSLPDYEKNILHLDQHLKVFLDEKGRGIYTAVSIKPDEAVVDYRGTEHPAHEYDQLDAEYKREGLGCYSMFNYTETKFLDATKSSGKGRLINHSAVAPNVFPREVRDGSGHMRVFLFAKKNIPAFSELLYTYNDKKSSAPFLSYSKAPMIVPVNLRTDHQVSHLCDVIYDCSSYIDQLYEPMNQLYMIAVTFNAGYS